jgi:protein arginine kinase
VWTEPRDDAHDLGAGRMTDGQTPDPAPSREPTSDSWSTPTEWLLGTGEASDVVLSSRARLARNLAGIGFITRASKKDRLKTLAAAKAAVMTGPLAPRMLWLDLHAAALLDRQILVERHLISKQLSKGRVGAGPAAAEDPRAVAVATDERLSIMVNEEDHLRIQAMRSGLALGAAYCEASEADQVLEGTLDVAFSPRFGYLTACPTNVGTGLRMSVMLHLPALRLTGDLERVKRAATDMNLAVRGFYGEGSEAVGDLYQISNQTTLGQTEEAIIASLETEILPRVVEYERLSRRELATRRRLGLEDQVWRAHGVLNSARLLTTEEAMQALSLMRLGVLTGVIPQDCCDLGRVHQLMLLVHPAHLQRALGVALDQEQRRAARAGLVRRRLASK